MDDHMSQIPIGEAPTRVDDELLDAPSFHIDYALDWYLRLVQFFMNGLPPVGMPKMDARRLFKK